MPARLTPLTLDVGVTQAEGITPVSKLKLSLVLAFVLALLAVAALGGGWKWRAPKGNAASTERVAGWTWDWRTRAH
jgi:hypothetical protein